jgi:four helix bundle protein
VIARQLLRSATSVGANYRAACRARSPQEMFSKLSIVEEEADECLYWIELLHESKMAPGQALRPLHDSANEILAMTVASKKTLRTRIGRPIGNRQSTIVNPRANRES